MAIRTNLTVFGFDVSSSFPYGTTIPPGSSFPVTGAYMVDGENRLSENGDERYSREFIPGEGIIIRKPLGTNLFESNYGVYRGFAIPYNEVITPTLFSDAYPNSHLGKIPSSTFTPHNPPLLLNTTYPGTLPSIATNSNHRFIGFTGGTSISPVYGISQIINGDFIVDSVNQIGDGGLPIPNSRDGSLFDPNIGNTGTVDGVNDFRFGSDTMPSLFVKGSIIEGLVSGARRFLIGKKSSTTQTESTRIQLSELDDLIQNGITGIYAPQTIDYIVPYIGSEDAYKQERHDLFVYPAVGGITPTKINTSFFKGTPFSSNRIDYSGIRMSPRKGHKSPFSIWDKYSLNKMVSPAEHYPEIDLLAAATGSPPDPRTMFLNIYGEGTPRNKAYAITPRHALTLNTKQHTLVFDIGDPGSTGPIWPAFENFVYGITGASAGYMTDMDEVYQKGDIVQFWDGETQTIVQRTIVDIIPLDVHTLHDALRSFTDTVLLPKRVNTHWWQPNIDSTGEETYYVENMGFALFQTYQPFPYRIVSPEPIGGITPDCTGENSVGSTAEPADYMLRISSENLIGPNNLRASFNPIRRFKDFIFDKTYHKDLEIGERPTNLEFTISDRDPNHPFSQFPIGVSEQSNFIVDGSLGDPIAISKQIREINQKFLSSVLTERIEAYQYRIDNNIPLPSQHYFDFFDNEIQRELIVGQNFERRRTRVPLSNKELIYNRLSDVIGSAIVSEESRPNFFKHQFNSALFGTIQQGTNQPPPDLDPSIPSPSIDDSNLSFLPNEARNTIKEFFPYGLNNIFVGSLNKETLSLFPDLSYRVTLEEMGQPLPEDAYRTSITWQYLVSHYKALLKARASVLLLDSDLPPGVKPIAFIDTRRSKLHKYELFLDQNNEGYHLHHCPIESGFYPTFYYGDAEKYGRQEYAVGSYIRDYSNPYGSSMIVLGLGRVGTCSSDYDATFLDSCGGETNATQGPKCKWELFEIAKGSNGVAIVSTYFAFNKYFAEISSDIHESSPCSACWFQDPENPLSTSLPTNINENDRLMTFNQPTNRGRWRPDRELPAPLFTYNQNGIPIMSRIVHGSGFYTGRMARGVVFEYAVTGHHGDPFVPGDEIYQNFDGSTGSPDPQIQLCGDSGCAKSIVMRHSKDEGRLTLIGHPSYETIMSNDMLLRCEETTGTGPSAYVEDVDVVLGNFCDQSHPCFQTVFGVTAYAFTNNQTTNEIKWCEVQSGGPLSVGSAPQCQVPYSFLAGWWWQGLVGPSSDPYGRNKNCESPTNSGVWEPYPQNSEHPSTLIYGTDSAGDFLSDQQVYLKHTFGGEPNFLYFGKVSDIFYKILDKLNSRNGVTGQYECRKEVINFNPALSDFVQPIPSGVTNADTGATGITDPNDGIQTPLVPFGRQMNTLLDWKEKEFLK